MTGGTTQRLTLVAVLALGLTGMSVGSHPTQAQATPTQVGPFDAPRASMGPADLVDGPHTRRYTVTVAAVYRRVQQAISRPGMLYHATIYVTDQQAQERATGTIKQWVDARRNVMRQEEKYGIPVGTPTVRGTTTTILTPQGGEVREDPSGRVFKLRIRDQPWTCPGATLAASAVLLCPGADLAKPSTTLVPHAQYAGSPTIVLVTVGIQRGDGGPVTITRRLYLDPHTFLPMAWETDGWDSGRSTSMRGRWAYAHTFIPARTVPAHFFDPATLGTPSV